jgi:hypothetical protein
MSEPIIVVFESVSVTKNGHKCYTTVEGQKYYVNKDKAITPVLNGQSKILVSVQDIGGKKLHWINWAGAVKGEDLHTPKPISAPIPPKTAVNTSNQVPTNKTQSKYSPEDRKAFEAKSDQIRQIAALNNSVGMVQACAESSNDGHFAGMSIAEVVKYWKNLQNQFYKEYYSQLSVGDKTSPSGIEVAEEVTSEEYNSGEAMD